MILALAKTDYFLVSSLRRTMVFLSIAFIAFQPWAILAQDKATKPELNELVFIQQGDLPIILSAPHGGTRQIPNVPERKGEGMKTGGAGFFAGRDGGTEELAYAVSDAIQKRFGKLPYMVVSRSHRKYLDPNRPPEIAYEDEDAKPVYDYYHGTISSYCREATNKFQTVLLLDLHGQGSKADTVFRGTRNGSTVKHLRTSFGEDAFTGEKSLFAMLHRQGWTVDPIPYTNKEQSGFTGGHIVGTYGSLNGTVVDAYQLEFGMDYRSKERRAKTAEELANAVAEYADAYLKVSKPTKKAAVLTKKTRVAVFVDQGVSPTDKLMQVLEPCISLSVEKIDANEIRDGQLAEFDVLILPGGSGGKQGNALGEVGREKIREFVRSGHGLMGICAGAYLASCDYSWSLNLLDAKVLDRQHWNRGFGTVEISVSEQGRDVLKDASPKVNIYYHQGPLLAPAQNPDVPDYEELAAFAGEIAKNGAPPGVMLGTTAIARGTFEKGRVFCFSPHPEKTDGLGNLVLNAIEWLASNSP